MGTDENRLKYKRDNLRYPSDLTGEEWAHVEPLIPPAKRGGGKRKVDVREVVNGIMYVLSTGCEWRYHPKDLPPKSTLDGYFDLWTYDGTLENIHHALYVRCKIRDLRFQALPDEITACHSSLGGDPRARPGGGEVDSMLSRTRPRVKARASLAPAPPVP